MVFSCTKKVRDKLKNYIEVENAKEGKGVHNWYVDLIRLERKEYFLFVNSKTLYSFIVYAGTKKELNRIEEIFEEQLKEQIIREIGSNLNYLNVCIPEVDNRFMKTSSQSIIGSMNDFKIQIELHCRDNGKLSDSYVLINHLINDIALKSLEYDQPVRVMKRELDLLINS